MAKKMMVGDPYSPASFARIYLPQAAGGFFGVFVYSTMSDTKQSAKSARGNRRAAQINYAAAGAATAAAAVAVAVEVTWLSNEPVSWVAAHVGAAAAAAGVAGYQYTASRVSNQDAKEAITTAADDISDVALVASTLAVECAS